MGIQRQQNPNKRVVNFKTDRTEKVPEVPSNEPETELERDVNERAQALEKHIKDTHGLESVEVAVMYRPGCVWFQGKIYC